MERKQSDLGPYCFQCRLPKNISRRERADNKSVALVQNGLIPMQGFRFFFNIGGFKHIKLTTVLIWVVYYDTDTCMHI